VKQQLISGVSEYVNTPYSYGLEAKNILHAAVLQYTSASYSSRRSRCFVGV